MFICEYEKLTGIVEQKNRNSKNRFKNILPVQIFVDQSLLQSWGKKRGKVINIRGKVSN